MTYTHKMNEKQYKHKVAFSYYYEPKEFNVSLRVRVDANQILKKIKDAGGDIIYDYNSILKSLYKRIGYVFYLYYYLHLFQCQTNYRFIK